MSTSLLFIATTLSFANAHADLIANWVSFVLSTDFFDLIFFYQVKKWTNAPTAKQLELLKEKRHLKIEQQKYSMIDEFAKYSKLQRRINALNEELKTSKQGDNPLWKNLVLSHVPQLVGTVILFLLVLYYRSTPIFRLPDGIDLVPFNYIISYPNGRNYVSLHFWIMSCNVVARLIRSKYS